MSIQNKKNGVPAQDDASARSGQGHEQGKQGGEQRDGKAPGLEQGREHKPNVNAAEDNNKPNEGENKDPGSRIVGDDQQAEKPGIRSAQRDSLHNAHGDR